MTNAIAKIISVLLSIFAFAILFRFDMSAPVAINSDDVPSYEFSARVYRLDRWTGEIDLCSVGCFGVDATNNFQ